METVRVVGQFADLLRAFLADPDGTWFAVADACEEQGKMFLAAAIRCAWKCKNHPHRWTKTKVAKLVLVHLNSLVEREIYRSTKR